ncbi:MAG: hypothetical protein M1445_06125 [Bacteroidetes bacterium]|nr:hypothetical protein [Bacteroidota bacterium]
MKKTGSEIENDVFKILKDSTLTAGIRGTIFREGMRPNGAKTEDAIVSFMTGLDAQIQTGVLNLNIYVPDIDNGSGALIKNGARCQALEILVNGIIQALKPSTEYRFSLGSIIQTFQAEDIKQHFVNCKIKFQLATF